MVDREKVIKGIESCIANNCRDCPYPCYCYYADDWPNELLKDALELLKEHEAVEPIITPWAEDEDGNIVVAKKECGKCGCQFFTERPNFCENCGTPILWEGR